MLCVILLRGYQAASFDRRGEIMGLTTKAKELTRRGVRVIRFAAMRAFQAAAPGSIHTKPAARNGVNRPGSTYTGPEVVGDVESKTGHKPGYKETWDNLGQSYSSAAHHVCLTTDEQDIRANGALTADFMRSVLQIEPSHHVLEIGCGVARVGRELAPHCEEWHGTDISGNIIAHARKRTEDIPNIFLHELPENSLSIFPDNRFDAVYCTIVFMHIDKPDMFKYIRETYRVLKPGGRAYFDTFNLLAPEAWPIFLSLVDGFPGGVRPRYTSQFSTSQELEKFMQEAGFSEIKVDDQNPQLVVALGGKEE
jgi:ubiquinone/menaquinone biosynthesis C-methylase UbiE